MGWAKKPVGADGLGNAAWAKTEGKGTIMIRRVDTCMSQRDLVWGQFYKFFSSEILLARPLSGAMWAMVSLDTCDIGERSEVGWQEPCHEMLAAAAECQH